MVPIGLLYELAKWLSERAGVFKDIYYTAGFSDPFEVYIGRCVIAYFATIPAVSAVAVAVHVLVGYPLLFTVVLSFLVAVIYTLLYLLIVLYYPVYKRYSLGVSIDSRLPYTIAYFAALAASGMALEAIVERVEDVEENKATRRELQLFLTDLRLLGVDILTALERRSRFSPSVTLSLFFAGLRDAYMTSGNLYEFSAFTVKQLLEFKREELRRVLNSVAILSEVYVTLMVAAPLMFTVMLAVIAMLGGAVGGLPPQLILALTLIVMVPASAAAMLVMLDGVLSRV